jgi:hypothetical protein
MKICTKQLKTDGEDLRPLRGHVFERKNDATDQPYILARVGEGVHDHALVNLRNGNIWSSDKVWGDHMSNWTDITDSVCIQRA